MLFGGIDLISLTSTCCCCCTALTLLLFSSFSSSYSFCIEISIPSLVVKSPLLLPRDPSTTRFLDYLLFIFYYYCPIYCLPFLPSQKKEKNRVVVLLVVNCQATFSKPSSIQHTSLSIHTTLSIASLSLSLFFFFTLYSTIHTSPTRPTNYTQDAYLNEFDRKREEREKRKELEETGRGLLLHRRTRTTKAKDRSKNQEDDFGRNHSLSNSPARSDVTYIIYIYSEIASIPRASIATSYPFRNLPRNHRRRDATLIPAPPFDNEERRLYTTSHFALP